MVTKIISIILVVWIIVGALCLIKWYYKKLNILQWIIVFPALLIFSVLKLIEKNFEDHEPPTGGLGATV